MSFHLPKDYRPQLVSETMEQAIKMLKAVFQEELSSQESPDEKIKLLYQIADQMKEMMAVLAGRGEEVPASIMPGAYRYLDLIHTSIGD